MMVRMGFWVRWCVAVWLACGLGFAQAALAPELSKGLNWLSAQVAAGGNLLTASPLATDLQSRSEAQRALQQLGTAPAALADAIALDSNPTAESLARRLLGQAIAGRDIQVLLPQLLALQNSDGGFGFTVGLGSNPRDTAWALLTLKAVAPNQTAVIGTALGYLQTNVYVDGSFGLSGGEVYATAYAALALSEFADAYNLSGTLDNARRWLVAQAGSSGYGSSLDNAVAVMALSSLTTDSTQYATARDALKTAQQADGSWGGDPYLTALALRALTATSGALSSPTTATIVGKITDSTGQALANVAISAGAAAAAVVSGSDGTFSLVNVTPGAVTVSISKIGYSSTSVQLTSVAGKTSDLGAVVLTAATNQAIVRGKVSKGSNGAALAGVQVNVSGSGNSASATTDANGGYELAGLTPGAVTVSASLSGYTSVTSNTTLAAGQIVNFSPALYQPGDPAAPTTGTLTGKVVAAATGQALSGVSIEWNSVVIGTTAADGRFSASLPAGNGLVNVRLSGYRSQGYVAVITAGSTLDLGTVSLAAAVTATSISGKVTSGDDGSPLAGAKVEVVGGTAIATTAADGSYTLSNLSGSQWDLRISATGFLGQSVSLQVAEPSQITRNFTLSPNSGTSLRFAAVTTNPSSVGANTVVNGSTTLTNTGNTAIDAVVILRLRDAQGKTIGSGEVLNSAGAPLGSLPLAAGQTVPITLRWNSGQFAPGTYQLYVRAAAVGSFSQSQTLGELLSEAAGSITLSAESRFGGSVTADPPVVRAGLNTAINLSAMIQNQGNVVLPGQTYTLTVRNDATNAVVTTREAIGGSALAVNALQALSFANWTPDAGGNYRLELSSAGAPGLVTQKVYVGDASQGTFTLAKTTAAPGNSTVRATVQVTGQNTTNSGSVSDPLVPIIKTAVQKAMDYNNPRAIQWINNNRCQGCHIAAQALVGNELTQKYVTVDQTARDQLFSVVAHNKLLDGTPLGTETRKIAGMINLWASMSSSKSNTVAKWGLQTAIDLAEIQASNGSWLMEEQDGWWRSRMAHTAFTFKGMKDALVNWRANKTPITPFELGFGSIGKWVADNEEIRGMTADTTGNLYATVWGYPDRIIKVDRNRTVSTVLTSANFPRAIKFAPSGLLYFTNNSGLSRIESNGTLTRIPIPDPAFTGIQTFTISADGTVYALVRNNIVKYTLAGQTTTINTNGQIDTPTGMVADEQGNLYITNQNLRSIVKVKPDGSLSTLFTDSSSDARYALSIDYANGALWFGGLNGVTKVDPVTGIGSKYRGSFEAFALVGLPSGEVFAVERVAGKAHTNLDAASAEAYVESVLSKAVNWLLDDANAVSDNLQTAQRLYALGVASKYYTDSAVVTPIRQKMNVLDQWLRANQNADGGWPLTSGNVSDPTITAQVGLALDTLDPSPQDAVLRKAVAWALNQQDVDGSWTPKAIFPQTRIAPTTFVSIWLPIVLDRLGGIDTDVDITLPANITLTNPDKTPTQTLPGSVGGQRYIWKLPALNASGALISFDLNFTDLAVGETRPAASKAVMAFSNSFDSSTVEAPFTIPTLKAVSGLDVTLTSDAASYSANSPVTLTARVANLGATAGDATLKIDIVAADGSKVAELPAITASAIPAGGQQSLTATWNTGVVLAGDYDAVASVYDAQGRKLSSSTVRFTISGNTGGAGSYIGLATDKASYQPFDTVNITAQLRNPSSNALINDVVVDENLRSADGLILYQSRQTLLQLPAAGSRQLLFAAPLNNSVPGSYVIEQIVSFAGQIVDTRTVTITVRPASESAQGLASALTGSLVASSQAVQQGNSVNFTWSATNKGNVALTNQPAKLVVIDPQTGVVVKEQALSLSLAVNQTQTGSVTWATSGTTAAKLYLAILSAQAAGATGASTDSVGVAQTTVTVQPRPPLATLLRGALTVTPASPMVGTAATIGFTVDNIGSQTLTGLDLRLVIQDADNSVLSSKNVTADLQAGRSLQDSLVWTVTDGTAATLKAVLVGTWQGDAGFSVEKTFTVTPRPVLSTGVSSTITLSSNEPTLGDLFSVTSDLKNIGPVAINNATLLVKITNPADGSTVFTRQSVISLDPNATLKEVAEWTVAGATGSRRVVVTLSLGAESVTLRDATITLKAKPVTAIDFGNGARASRLLVYFNCPPGWDRSGGWWHYERNAPCFGERQSWLANTLTQLGVAYRIVTDEDAFVAALRSNQYATYWIFGAVERCSGRVQDELREAIFRGDTLLIDSGLSAWRNFDLLEMAGVKYTGKLQCTQQRIDTLGGLYPKATLNTAGLPLNLRVVDGVIEAKYSRSHIRTVDDDDDNDRGERDEDHRARHSRGPSNSESYPAIVSKRYGKGKVLLMNFDFIETLRTTQQSLWSSVLGTSLDYLVPAYQRASQLGGYIPLAFELVNPANTAVSLDVTLDLPAGARLAEAQPAVTSASPVKWRINLPANGKQIVNAAIYPPSTPGVSEAVVKVYTAGSSTLLSEKRYPVDVVDIANLPAQAIADLNALNLTGSNKAQRDNAVKDINNALKYAQNRQWENSIRELLDGADALQSINGPDLTNQRLTIDWLLRDVELLSGVAALAITPSGVVFPDKDDNTAPKVRATVQGKNQTRTLGVEITPAGGDANKDGEYFVAAYIPSFGNPQWYVLTPTGWVLQSGAGFPAIASGRLGFKALSVLQAADTSLLLGAQVYAGTRVNGQVIKLMPAFTVR